MDHSQKEPITMPTLIKKMSATDYSRSRSQANPHSADRRRSVWPYELPDFNSMAPAHRQDETFLLTTLISLLTHQQHAPSPDDDVLHPHLSGNTILHIHQIR
jgi:hypothetical protein